MLDPRRYVHMYLSLKDVLARHGREQTCGLPCRNQGCPDMACRICAENPNRRCRGNFADKYLAGDVLKATCGAPIRVEIINRTTGDSASKQEYADVLLEVLPFLVSATGLL